MISLVGANQKRVERKSMKQKYMFVAAMLLVLMVSSVFLTNIYIHKERDHAQMDQSEQDFYILTSFYPIYIAAKNIVGDCEGVILQNLSEPQTGCMHDYQLTTEDMRKLSYADAFLVNGGGIENFLSDVARQYPDISIINASEGIQLADGNAHVWMSIPDHMTQIQTITKQLAALDKAHASVYKENSRQYLARLEDVHHSQQTVAQKSKAARVLIFHEAFAYIARDYGLTVSGGIDLDEERQISAGEVAGLLDQIRKQKVDVILAEELYGRQMCEALKQEADIQVIYLDTCVRGDYSEDSYCKAMKENITRLSKIGNQDKK